MKTAVFPARSLCVVVAALTSGACRSPAGPIEPPAPGPPQLQCPSPVVVETIGTSSSVQYQTPTAVGGVAPVTVTCSQPSGATFPLGVSPIVCTASDAQARQAQCAFDVRVLQIPQLKGTKIVAFGDSMTEGEVATPVSVLAYDPLNAYPTLLGQSLSERYKAQTITVINEGRGGERMLVTGEDRVETVVERHRPDILIVFEGVNDINSGALPEDVGQSLRRAVRRAVRDGVPLVLVSTIVPGVAGRTKPPDPEKVDALNNEIRSWVGLERAVLVDNFASFAPRKEALIGQDGLHPTAEGMKVLAENFQNAIRERFEQPAPTSAVARLFGW